MSQQINLYNPALLPKPDVFTGRTILVTLSSLTMALLAAYGITAYLAARAVALEQLTSGRLAQLQLDITQLSQQVSGRKPSAQLTAELADLDTSLSGRNEVMAVLNSGAPGDTRGVSEYFRAFARQSVEGLWLTGFTLAGAGNDISIEGRTLRADLVPIYIQRLSKEDALRGHRFATLSVHAPTDISVNGESGKGQDFLEFHMASRAPEAASTQGQSR